MFLEISQNSLESTCARCFAVNFAKFLRTPFLQTTPWRPLLTWKNRSRQNSMQSLRSGEQLQHHHQFIYLWHKNIVVHIYKIWLIKAKLKKKKSILQSYKKQIQYKKLIKTCINILQPSLKKIQNTGIKKDSKIDAEEQLKWNQYDQYILCTVCRGIGW